MLENKLFMLLNRVHQLIMILDIGTLFKNKTKNLP